MQVVAIQFDGVSAMLLCKQGDVLIEKRMPVGIMHIQPIDYDKPNKLRNSNSVDNDNADGLQTMQIS
jgi:hypothetical protein